jgi:uncharacterized protein YfaS (alpha-2-macroglobulin family)
MILNRNGDYKTANKIAASVKEKATQHKDNGIYFAQNLNRYEYHSREETQSILIEAFNELNQDDQFIEGMKTWLLQQKRVEKWSCNMTTAKACYALLLTGKSWQAQNNSITVSLGETVISSEKLKKESGSGYFKEVINGKNINSGMGDILIRSENKNNMTTPIWGGFYWQYTDKIEHIKNSSSTLSVSREFYLQKIENNKSVLIKLSDSSKIYTGDKILVRWTIKNDRLLEYVSLKDLRAACLEPISKTSGYRWKDGIGYYESIRDGGSDLFFNVLPAGTFMIESGFYVTHSGIFSLGYANVQCMYTPEISAHSDGGKIEIETSE